jgi:hypothetical protein
MKSAGVLGLCIFWGSTPKTTKAGEEFNFKDSNFSASCPTTSKEDKNSRVNTKHLMLVEI